MFLSMSSSSSSRHVVFVVSYLRCVLVVVLIVATCCCGQNEDDEIDFPPMLDSEDIAYYSEMYDIDGLYWALSNVFERSQRNYYTPSKIKYSELPHTLVSRGGGNTYTTKYKLQLDIEQAKYLIEKYKKKKSNATLAKMIQKDILPIYEKTLKNIPELDDLSRTHGLYPFKSQDYDLGIDKVYNKAYHHTASLVEDDLSTKPLLSDTLNFTQIEHAYLTSVPQVVVIDDILSEETLHKIRDILYESTVWYQTKMPLKFGGYVGAYIDDGLYDKILLQLAFELNKSLPNIIGQSNPLRYLWAYKYDSRYTGINTHADQAAVNVNLWITPDDANLNKDTGGLVIYTAKPPADWDFVKYNTMTDFVAKELLEPTNYANITVPYKENRAVIFDSSLFHHTDEFTFKDGYKNRRINLTILYGTMNTNDGGNGGGEQQQQQQQQQASAGTSSSEEL